MEAPKLAAEKLEIPEVNPSIVEQETAEIGAVLSARFAQRGCPDIFPIGQVTRLLHTSPSALTRACRKLGFFLEESPEDIHSTAMRLQEKSCVYMLTQDQILALNNHPYMRTIESAEVSRILDASVAMIDQAADTYGIEPAAPAEEEQYTYTSRQGEEITVTFPRKRRYDKNQIVQLKEAIKIFNAPSDFVAESKLLAAASLSPVALKDVTKELGVRPKYFRNPEAGNQEYYFNPTQVIAILHHLKKKGWKFKPSEES